MRLGRVAILALIGALAVALGASPPAIAGPGAGSPTGHVWLVLDDADGDGASLVHAPPRRAGAAGEPASSPGTLRLVRPLAFSPAGVAATGSELVLISALRSPAGDAPNAGASPKALSLRAVPSRMGDFWVYEPQGRLRAVRPLPDGVRVRSVSSDGGRVVVLGELDGAWWLGGLSESGWREMRLPAEAESAPDLRLTPSVGGPLGLYSPEATGPIRAWWRDSAQTDDDPGSWRTVELAVRSGLGVRDELFLAGNEWFVTRPGADGLSIALVDSEGETRGALIERAPPTAAIGVEVDAEGRRRRLIAVWRTRTETGLVTSDAIEIAEVSLDTFTTMYRGAPVHASPISPGAFRALAASLVALAAIALLIVLGPGDRPIELPAGVSLAEPGRRFIASVIDALVALWLSSAIFGVRMMEVLTLEVLFRGDGSWAVVPATLGIGMGVGIAGEWAFGTTPGKLLIGLRVIDARPGRGAPPGRLPRPSLWQSFVRNGVKWALPPVAALAMLDPTGRHRGDVLSRAAVVIPGEADEEGAGTGEDGSDGSA